MKLNKLILTKNSCYITGEKIKVKGIMVHSTGANNPWLKRYVGPNDGKLGTNKYGNHWNTFHPEGREVCPHAFIGKLADGSVATYQTLPWNYRGWHCGGSANNTHIGFEMCEDDLKNPVYFKAAYKEAVELCAYLCKKFNLDPTKNGVIIGHYEGHQRGLASNHGDPRNWFSKHNKTMNDFRADVKAAINNENSSISPSKKPAQNTIKEGSLVKITGSKYYSGKSIPTWVKKKNWYVHSLNGSRVVIDKSEDGKSSIMSPIHINSVAVIGSSSTATYRIHTVVSGDSLWEISRKYLGKGSRYPEIKVLNNLTSNVLYSGMKLKIPN